MPQHAQDRLLCQHEQTIHDILQFQSSVSTNHTDISKTDPHEDNHNIRLAQLLQEKGLGTSSLHKFPKRKHSGMRVLLLVFAAAMFHAKLDPYFAQYLGAVC